MIAVAVLALRSMGFASLQVRILAALVAAQLVLALPLVLPFGRAVADASNHRADPVRFASELDYTAWFDLREGLTPFEPILFGMILGAFLLGVFASGGWLESFAHRDAAPPVRTFASGGAGRFFRFLRLALFSIAGIALARWLFYGPPLSALQTAITGSTELGDFGSETASRNFQWMRSIGFASTVAVLLVVSDLARAVIVIGGGRSALVGWVNGLWLFLRHPLRSILGASVPFGVELAALVGVSFLVDLFSVGAATKGNLAGLFVATQLAVVLREISRAGRLGALLGIARDDHEARVARRWGAVQQVPLVAAAGHGTAGEEPPS